MAAAPARFTFDLDLGRRQERHRMVSDAALDDLLQQARMKGFAEGEQGVAASATRILAAAGEALADRSAAMISALDEAKATTRAEAVELAASVARKLAAHLIARQPEAELQALLEECLISLEGVPHLVVRCHPSLAEGLRESAMARIAGAGFSGRLVVIGDPEQGLSDGRVEWADGGVVRDLADITADIDKAIAAYLSAQGPNRPEETRS